MKDEDLGTALHAAFVEAIEKIGVEAFRRTSFFLAGRSKSAPCSRVDSP